MLPSRIHTLLKDDRNDLRIKENSQIPWQIKYKQLKGIAKVRNISISGMLVETDTPFTEEDECIFSFESDPEAGIFIPQIGRLVWHKKKRFSHKKYLSGIKFLEADDQVLTQMRLKVKLGVEKFIKQKRATMISGFVLCTVFVGLIGYMLWVATGVYQDLTTANQRLVGASGQQIVLSQSFNNLYRSSEIKLAQAEEKLAIANQLIAEDKTAITLFTRELEATKALLNQTETMLVQSNERNTNLRDELLVMRLGDETGFSNQTLNDGEEIMSITDAQSLMSTYRQKIRSVKNEIKRLKRRDRGVRATMISQIDEQKLLLGNNGYFVKDGETIEVDEDYYQSLTADQSRSTVVKKNVEIDVTFFE